MKQFRGSLILPLILVVVIIGVISLGMTGGGQQPIKEIFMTYFGPAQNVLIDNNYSFQGKDTGGVARSLLTMTNTNQTRLNAMGGQPILFTVGGAEKARITSSGNVGIGTTNPTAKLEVNGSVKVSGSINKQPTNPPLFRWLRPGVLATYTGTGLGPYAIAFDGTNMWTANYDGYNVTKITPTGGMVNAYGLAAGSGPCAIAFDGTNMWTANRLTSSVTRITPAGVRVTYTGTDASPYAIAFDGTNMWTANYNGNSVTKITPTGVMTHSGPTGAKPTGIAFDGTNMWTANSQGLSVTKITPTGVTSYPIGYAPLSIAFDGTNMWTANYGDPGSVTKVTPAGVATTYTGTGAYPWGIAFDGTNMWTANNVGASVTRITPTGVMTQFGTPGANPWGIAFDGTNMWTANSGSNNITKILVITQ